MGFLGNKDDRSPDRYEAVVNKGSVNMRAFSVELNKRWREGWRLHTAFEQDGNTVVIYERRDA